MGIKREAMSTVSAICKLILLVIVNIFSIILFYDFKLPLGMGQCHSFIKHLLLYDDIHNISLAIKTRELINQFLSLRSLKLGIKAAWLYYHAQDHLTIRLVAKRGFKESFLQEAYLNQIMPCK